MTDYNDGKWHGWNGGECPVHSESRVETVWRYSDGSIRSGQNISFAKNVFFTGNEHGKLIAFRIVKERKEPHEVFLSQNPHSGGWFEALPEHKDAVKFREVTE